MKAYTDLEQSKKLAEILPIKSADMYYLYGDETEEHFGEGFYEKELENWFSNGRSRPVDIPCWSLAALLNILPSASLDSSDDHYFRLRCKERFSEWHDNPIDACVEMILKLYKLKML